MNFSIIVPVYNNNNTLRRVLQGIQNNFAGEQHQYEIVFVNDCSIDQSLQTLLELRNAHSNISVVNLSRNYNQAIAVLAGLEHAKGNYQIVISADLQEEELIIKKLLRCLEQNPNADLILGVRAQNSDYLIFRILSTIFYQLIRLKIKAMPEGGFDTGLMRRDLTHKLIAAYHEKIFLQATILQLSGNPRHIAYQRLKSSAEKVQLKSLIFKIRYFLNCIRSVYFPERVTPKKSSALYTVAQYFEKSSSSF